MTEMNHGKAGTVACVDVIATPFFQLGYRHGFHERAWPRSYEGWPFAGQINYERGRQFACFCLAMGFFVPLKQNGVVPPEVGQALGLARFKGFVTR